MESKELSLHLFQLQWSLSKIWKECSSLSMPEISHKHGYASRQMLAKLFPQIPEKRINNELVTQLFGVCNESFFQCGLFRFFQSDEGFNSIIKGAHQLRDAYERKQLLEFLSTQRQANIQMHNHLKSVFRYTKGRKANLVKFRELFGGKTEQSKNWLISYLNGIFNFEITAISSITIKEDPFVSAIICDCIWRKNGYSGRTKIYLTDDERKFDDGIYYPDNSVAVLPPNGIPKHIVFSFLRYKILGHPYPIFCTMSSLRPIQNQPSVCYIYIQLPLIEEMIQCKKMLDSGLIDTKILESDAVREWLEILNNVRILNLQKFRLMDVIASKKQMYKLSEIRNNIVYFTRL